VSTPGEVSARFDDLVAGVGFELVEPRDLYIAKRPDEVVDVLRAADAAARAGLHVAGFVTYEAAAGLDPSLDVATWPPEHRLAALPLAWFCAFASRVPVTPSPRRAPGPLAAWTIDRSRDWHADAVASVRAGIEKGDYYQVNLTARMTASDIDPVSAYESGAHAQRGRYHALIRTGELDVVSSSPELFFDRDGNHIVTMPMKGTARRGRWPDEDAERAEALRTSAKERAENVMIVDLLRNDLAHVAQIGSIHVPELFTVRRFPTVWQLTSTVAATLRDDVDLAELFRALFPCGSVTGAPKQAAMSAIAELEQRPRGVYCGAVGWLGPGATRAQFSVGIRTMTCVAGYAEYGTGGAITWSSHADHEWAELLTKADVLMPPPEPAGLFETLRFDPDEGAVQLGCHLDRLEASAEYFAIRFDRDEAITAVQRALHGREMVGRLRIRLDADGRVDAQVADVALTSGPVRLAVANTSVRSDDRLLFHKQFDRSRYDLARAEHPDVDDVVLHNERGEITETTTANLAILIDGRWWTPALDSGLLPGVERDRLVQSGVLAERAVRLDELSDAQDLAVVNSLRGWRSALLT
jgi:para-aminobenzoate synthetase/4-amino-4-deoxychorismate lyase